MPEGFFQVSAPEVDFIEESSFNAILVMFPLPDSFNLHPLQPGNALFYRRVSAEKSGQALCREGIDNKHVRCSLVDLVQRPAAGIVFHFSKGRGQPPWVS